MTETDEKLDKLISYLESNKGKNNPIYIAVSASVIASVILWGLTQIVNAPSSINTKIDAVNTKVINIENEIKDFKKDYDNNTAKIQYNFSVLNEHGEKLINVYTDDSNLRSGKTNKD